MCNIDNDWPFGRAIFCNEDLSFAVKINGEDQLEIEYSLKKTSINDYFAKFLAISDHLERELKFNKDEKYGYITTLPENLGTSLRAQVIIQVPNVTNKNKKDTLSEMIKDNENHKLNIKGDLDA